MIAPAMGIFWVMLFWPLENEYFYMRYTVQTILKNNFLKVIHEEDRLYKYLLHK